MSSKQNFNVTLELFKEEYKDVTTIFYIKKKKKLKKKI